MKSWRYFIGFMAVMLYGGCGGEIVEPESVDADYSITYYAQPPHNKESVGYLLANTDFVDLSPIGSSPYTLLISVGDKKGQEAVDFIRQKEGSPIKSIQEVYSGLAGNAKMYRVVTDKYFQSRNFYVSESYRTNQSKAGAYDINVLPYITVKMHAGQDVSSVEEEYKSVLKLYRENDDGTFLFSCSFKTSYEVLMLSIHVYDKLEVAWAEPVLLRQ